MYIVGIDPGLHGAFVTLLETCVESQDMPTVKNKKGKKTKQEYDLKSIWNIISMINNEFVVFLEQTQSLPPGLRVQASYGLGYCQGLLEGMLVARKIRYELVRPQEWQKHFGITKSKGDKKVQSYKIATQLFPDAELVTPRGRVLDGRSDALLIAEYGKRKLRLNGK